MLTLSSAGDEFVLLVIVGSAVVLVLVYLLHQLRIKRRDAHLKLESTQSEDERAHNQIRIARAGAELLRRDGHDVAGIDRALASAEAAQARGEHARALQLAQTARAGLVAIREGRAASTASSPDPLLGTDALSPALARTLPTAVAAPETEPARTAPKLPAHQVEARFEISVLRGELAGRRPGAAGNAAGWAEANALASEAQSAYDAGRFPDAWRLALQGRRRLGSAIERIGARGPGPVPEVASAGPVAAETPGAPLSPEPRVAPGRALCLRCSRPLRGGDRFCRACGAELGGARCPRCGAPQDASDRFCAVCGAPVGA